MPVWRCPHCGNPQPESSRCWVCHRLTTSCGTCRHFRRGIAGGLGLCGLDPRRLALNAAEIRPCWTAAIVAISDEADERRTSPERDTLAGNGVPSGPRQARAFVPVEELAGALPVAERGAPPAAASASPPPAASMPEQPAIAGPAPVSAPGDRWSLWAELEA